MKRVLILLLSAVLMTAALTGCSSGEEDALVSKIFRGGHCGR